MTRIPRRGGLSHLLLLIAALAHFLGGELGAWLHRNDAPPPAATVFAPGSEGDRIPPPGHPRDCAVCQTTADGSPALPAMGLVLRVAEHTDAQPISEVRSAPHSPAATPSLPRAPPARS